MRVSAVRTSRSVFDSSSGLRVAISRFVSSTLFLVRRALKRLMSLFSILPAWLTASRDSDAPLPCTRRLHSGADPASARTPVRTYPRDYAGRNSGESAAPATAPLSALREARAGPPFVPAAPIDDACAPRRTLLCQTTLHRIRHLDSMTRFRRALPIPPLPRCSSEDRQCEKIGQRHSPYLFPPVASPVRS